MATERDRGGPAFPQIARGAYSSRDGGYTQYPCAEDGMTLRDYFAGQALIGVIQSSGLSRIDKTDEPWTKEGITYNQWASQAAYKIADAMLAARKI